MRVTKNLMISDIGVTVRFNISSRRFHSFMETLPLNLVEFLGRSVPTISGRRRSLLPSECARHRHNRHPHE
jgi:hypothetical protein